MGANSHGSHTGARRTDAGGGSMTVFGGSGMTGGGLERIRGGVRGAGVIAADAPRRQARVAVAARH